MFQKYTKGKSFTTADYYSDYLEQLADTRTEDTIQKTSSDETDSDDESNDGRELLHIPTNLFIKERSKIIVEENMKVEELELMEEDASRKTTAANSIKKVKQKS